MADANLLDSPSIKMKLALLRPSTTSATALVNNSASNTFTNVVRFLHFTNTDTGSVTVTISVYPQDDGAGTAHPLVNAVSVPASTSVQVIAGGDRLPLPPDTSLYVTVSVADKVTFICGYDQAEV